MVAPLQIRFGLTYRPTSWFRSRYTTCLLPHSTHHTPSAVHRPPITVCHTPPASPIPVPGFSSTIGRVLEIVLGCILESLLGAYITWEHIVMQAGSVSLSAIGSVFESVLKSMLESLHGSTQSSRPGVCHRVQLGVPESMPGSVFENMLGVPGSVQSSRLVVCNRVQSWMYFRAYLGACNKLYLPACFQVCCMHRTITCVS